MFNRLKTMGIALAAAALGGFRMSEEVRRYAVNPKRGYSRLRWPGPVGPAGNKLAKKVRKGTVGLARLR